MKPKFQLILNKYHYRVLRRISERLKVSQVEALRRILDSARESWKVKPDPLRGNSRIQRGYCITRPQRVWLEKMSRKHNCSAADLVRGIIKWTDR